jgi:hypothetical protein
MSCCHDAAVIDEPMARLRGVAAASVRGAALG